MEFGVIVSRGFEKVAVEQIREILPKINDIRIEDTVVLFKTERWEDVHEFIYMSQIANRVIFMIDEIEYENDDELISKCSLNLPKNTFLKDTLLGGISGFRVSVRADVHTDVTPLEADIGGAIIDYAKNLDVELKVNLSNPQLDICVYTHNRAAYIGIDLSGDLAKRDYKLFNNAVSLKGPTAFGLLMTAGYTPDDVFLNPYCYSGTIEIEAALYSSRTSHRFYNKSFPFMKLPAFVDNNWEKFFEKIDNRRVGKGKKDERLGKFSITGADPLLSSITAAVKNAKIAGVESFIDFRRIDIDWLELKFEERSVDKIISFHPGSSKFNTSSLAKNFHELFYNAEYILKDNGVMIMMCLSKDLLIKQAMEYFSIDRESDVHLGGQVMHILFFKKNTQSVKK